MRGGSSVAEIEFHSSKKFPEIMTPGGEKKKGKRAFLMQRSTVERLCSGAVWCSEGALHDGEM